MSRQPPVLYRFGQFELDSADGRLLKAGIRTRLEDQPTVVLQTLLDRPGEVVSRAELQQRLWPVGTHVDFEGGLSTAVAKLRRALGDSPTHPRFVETVPKKGYRFLASVEVVGRETADGAERKFRGGPLWWWAGFAAAGALVWALTSPPSPDPSPQRKLRRLTFHNGLTYQPTISADGRLIAYSSDHRGDGQSDIWIQQTSGSEPVRVTDDPANDIEPSISPDGAQIAFTSSRDPVGVYIVPALGGTARLLAEHGQSPRFSPDGKWVAYQRSESKNRKPWIVAAQGGKAQAVGWEPADSREAEYWPIWLPDSRRLLASGAGTMDILSLEGGPPRPIGVVPAMLREQLGGHPIFGPPRFYGFVDDGARIVFSAGRGDALNLWSVGFDEAKGATANDFRPVTSGPGFHTQASIAAETGHIVFASLEYAMDLWSLPVEGNTGRHLGSATPLTTDRSVNLAPYLMADGRSLSYISDRAGSEDVWVRDLDTGKETRIAAELSGLRSPAVLSPDGTQVAYQAMPGKELIVASVSDGSPRLTCEPCKKPRAWSSDGSRILYEAPGGRLGVLDPSSGETREIVIPDGIPVFYADFAHHAPWVAFASSDERKRGRVAIAPIHPDRPTEKSEWTFLTAEDEDAGHPTFSPNDQIVYYFAEVDGRASIRAQRLDPVSWQPEGRAWVVQDLELNANWSPTSSEGAHIAVGEDRMIFNQAKIWGDVWLLEP